MRGFLAISNEAAALAECRPEFAGAIVRLYRQADAMGWRRPFPCADAWLMIRFGLSKRQAREMLTLLVDSGCIDVVSEGDNRTPRRVNVICPLDAILDRSKAARVADSSGAADRRTKNETCGNAVPDDVDCRPDRRLDRRLDRSESTPAADPSVDADRRPDRRLDRRLDRSNSDSRSRLVSLPSEEIGSSSPPSDPDPVPHPTPPTPTPKPKRKRQPPTKAHPLTIEAWDQEHARAFDGAPFVWVWKGKDPDGKKVSRWIQVAADNAHIDPELEPGPIVDALRLAFRAYFREVLAGMAYPLGKPPSTFWFDRDVSTWLRTDPTAPIRTRRPGGKADISTMLRNLQGENNDATDRTGIGHRDDDPPGGEPPERASSGESRKSADLQERLDLVLRGLR